MTIYEMTKQVRALYDLLCAEEIDEQTFNDTVESIGADEKINAYCMVIQQLQTDAENCKSEKKRLDARIQMFERSRQRMKELLDELLKSMGKEKEKTDKYTVYHTSTQSVRITDINKIPSKYFRPQTEENIMKNIIKRIIKAGNTVEGAELIEQKTLVIR